MSEYLISGIPVIFPFEPYELQKDYMSKVIECLENGTNGVLESPTGTGKTLSLLCSSLAWLISKKLQTENEFKQKAQAVAAAKQDDDVDDYMMDIISNTASKRFSSKIIYCSRTHSQIAQAMQELKNTSYSKQVKATVVGSREQLCIHHEVMKETNNSNKIHLCKIKLVTHSCNFYNKVEKAKEHHIFKETNVMDIEDLVKIGQKLPCCPYFMAKQLINDADIIFMPYNYLLDPMARKANNIILDNNVIILDEAHNVEKVCEDSASVQFSSSEIALCIDDLTHTMKKLEEGPNMDMGEDSKDFTMEDLALLKEIVLRLEKAIDDIHIPVKGQTFPGSYIFELLRNANITNNNVLVINKLLDSIIQYLATVAEKSAAFRRSGGLQKLYDLLTIVFSDKTETFQAEVGRCYKVFVEIEPVKQNTKSGAVKEGWIQPKAIVSQKGSPKIINYWCFNPGFGMQHLLGKNVRSIILTSGTLAPLKPLIAELGIPVSVRLENPHIIKSNQICVKIISQGPDKEPLMSNFQNRDNPKFIMSLGRTILSLCPVIPHGLLVFFTSYSMLYKCREAWQNDGIWSQIQKVKPIFVEPKTKEAFTQTMNDYYANIRDPAVKGAIFMAVCRGKVSEGLDFADMNGRAVIITGLPFPPFMDQRVILKKTYLQENRTSQNEMLTGDEWYFLEATRAVNQAIGRVIRHRNDYGAIIFCDSRFQQQRQQAQLSSWIQGHLKKQNQPSSFGAIFGEITRFFRNAEKNQPQFVPKEEKISRDILDDIDNEPTTSLVSQSSSSIGIRKLTDFNKIASNAENSNAVFSWNKAIYENVSESLKIPLQKNIGFLNRLGADTKTIDFNNVIDVDDDDDIEENSSLVTIHKRERTGKLLSPAVKKRKFVMIENDQICTVPPVDSNLLLPEDRKDVLKLLKSSLSNASYTDFLKSLIGYQKDSNINALLETFSQVFKEQCFHYLFRGMRRFIKDIHKPLFDEKIKRLK